VLKDLLEVFQVLKINFLMKLLFISTLQEVKLPQKEEIKPIQYIQEEDMQEMDQVLVHGQVVVEVDIQV
jgi:hypothetical protein